MTAGLVQFEAALGRMGRNELRDAQDTYEAGCRRAESAAKAEADLRDEFLALVHAGDLTATATFEPPRTDYANRRKDGSCPARATTLFDVVLDMSSYRDYDKRLMELFVRAVNGAHVAADAQELMADMAAHYASMNAEVD
jgi:hypothetical protein